MHRSRRDFFPTSRKAIDRIKIHYWHLNSVTIWNLIFGCFLIFSFHTSLQNYPTSRTRGPWWLQHFSHTSLGKSWQKMRCELCARACWTDSVFVSHFWLLEGSEKPPAGEMPAITSHSVYVNSAYKVRGLERRLLTKTNYVSKKQNTDFIFCCIESVIFFSVFAWCPGTFGVRALGLCMFSLYNAHCQNF